MYGIRLKLNLIFMAFGASLDRRKRLIDLCNFSYHRIFFFFSFFLVKLEAEAYRVHTGFMYQCSCFICYRPTIQFSLQIVFLGRMAIIQYSRNGNLSIEASLVLYKHQLTF